MPTRLIDTQLMEAASDESLADFDADGLAEIHLAACLLASRMRFR